MRFETFLFNLCPPTKNKARVCNKALESTLYHVHIDPLPKHTCYTYDIYPLPGYTSTFTLYHVHIPQAIHMYIYIYIYIYNNNNNNNNNNTDNSYNSNHYYYYYYYYRYYVIIINTALESPNHLGGSLSIYLSILSLSLSISLSIYF